MKGLAQTLVLTGAVRAADMSAAIAQAGGADGPELQQLLVSNKLATEAQVAEAIALHTGHRYIDLANMPLDPSIVALVPGNLCRKYSLIPIDRRGDRLTVGILDPNDIVALDDVASITDLFVEPVVVAQDALAQMFERFLRSDEELSELSSTIEESSESTQASMTESLEEQDNDAPIVRFVNLLIAQAINDRASDIHVEPGEKQLTVRFRIDGVLHEMQKADRAIQDGIISRLKIMSSIDIAEKRKPQDGRLSVTHEGRPVDLRVATLPTVWGEKIVMRILDNTGQVMTMRDLLFSSDEREAVPRGHHAAARHDPRHRPDRIGQVDEPLHGASRDREPEDQRHHGRRPGGVPHRRHQPGAGQQPRRTDVLERAALDPAKRPRCRARR